VINDQGEEEKESSKGYLSSITGYIGGGTKKPKGKKGDKMDEEPMIERAETRQQ
jgi:hypothetical protein